MSEFHSQELDRLWVPPPEGDVPDTEIERTLTDMFSVIATPKDGAGHRILGWRKNDLPNKNRTYMKIWGQGDTGGHTFDHQVFGVNEWKIDSAAIVVEGRDAYIYTLAHSYLDADKDPATGYRPSAMGVAVIPNVWVPVAVGGGVEPESPTPCVPPGNRKYFKPNKTVTRGQVAKMIAIATGRADPHNPQPPDTQTFEDVAVGSTFHEFVEVLSADEVMGGYPCTP